MLFTSQVFIVCFLPVVLLLYYTIFKFSRRLQNIFLLIASLVFYAWGEPWFVIILMVSIGANWFFGLLAYSTRGAPQGRLVIAAMLAFNLLIIFIFKYLMFTLDILNSVFHSKLDVGTILLPIGISFFTFQAISYVVDIYRGKGELQRNPLNVGLYIAFFPQLVAGPIIRYETISEQILNRKETMKGFSEGVCRFLVGFSKKILLANNLALVADQAFRLNEGSELSVSMAWVGAIAYTLQIYFDFSGYSDMAIGLGRMFGFKFPENFNYPYISKSTAEFWRRWHISLGSWFRDYVYIPMGGSRVKKPRMIFNLLVVWGLTGLWHGANWTFILWGLMYFVTITLERLSHFEKWGAGYKKLLPRTLMSSFKHIYTMLLVMLGWVLFRAETVGDAFHYIGVLFGRGATSFFDDYGIGNVQEYYWFFLLGILFTMPVAKYVSRIVNRLIEFAGNGKLLFGGIHSLIYTAVMIMLFLVSFSYLVKGSYNPFIYFNF